MISQIQGAGNQVATVYVDTVGEPEAHKAKL